ncbi:SIR2 family protein [Herbiconiux sp. P16]|uniref:P-loop NTPase n=1 Tax=Herbiconiux wuyangfengii TaxID=3342794 RepID=UPI0035BA5D40
MIFDALSSDEDRDELKSVLASIPIPAEKYQRAFQFLVLRQPPHFRERVIRLITLRAYRSIQPEVRPTEADLSTYESDISGWNLPPGVESLGRTLNGLPEDKRGPVLTTNFDPLVEIAIRKSGSPATTYVQVDDSSFMTNLQVTSVPAVVHLHGFWRTASTLHTADQLGRDRPALTSALRAILGTHTLLVIGYGGWTDVITQQILQILQERNSETLDILWALHESGPSAQGVFELSALLETLRTAAPGNVTFYQGVDAEELFPKLESRVASILNYDESPTRRAASQSLVGWTDITPTFVERSRSRATPEDALTFFDGRLPNWSDAASPFVPPRSSSREVINQLSGSLRSGEATFTLLVGPSGEGKSMILKQAAVLLSALDSDLRILSLESDDFGSIEAVMALDDARGYVLLIDDAADHLNQLERLVQSIRVEGKHRIHIIAAAGDSDWRSRGGHLFAWSRHIRARQFPISGISRADALSIVSGWESLGPNALGALANLATREDRVDELVRVAGDRFGPSEGTLLGALLVTRYGPGLRQHVRSLMSRLSERSLAPSSGTNYSLLDALVVAAFLHANSVPELTFQLFAEALGLSESELHANVIGPLGKEAALSSSLGKVFVRHRLIAEVICELAIDFEIPLTRVIEDLVSAAVGILDPGPFNEGLVKVAYLSKQLSNPDMRLTAGRAAITANPHRLSYYTTLSSVQRSIDPDSACATNREAIPYLSIADDPESLSGFYMEWGIAEGNAGNHALNVVLVGASLRDGIYAASAPINPAWNSSSLIYALTQLWRVSNNHTVLQGLKGALDLASTFSESHHPDWRQKAEEILWANGYSLEYPAHTRSLSRLRDIQAAWDVARRASSESLPTGLPLGTGFQSISRITHHR